MRNSNAIFLTKHNCPCNNLCFSSNNEAKMSQLLDLHSFVNETFVLEEIANLNVYVIC